MKIIHVITRLILGGAQENTLLTVTGLIRKYKAEVSVVTGPEIDWKFVGSYLPTFPIHVCPFLTRDISPFDDVLALHWLTGFLARKRPDIVHTHSAKAGVLGRLACGITGIPAVHTVHGLPYHSAAATPVRFAYDTLEKIAGRYTCHFIAVGKEMQHRALKYARPGTGCSIVRSGVAVEEFSRQYEQSDMRRKFKIPAGAKVVGMLTRIAKQKGVDHALFLLSRLRKSDPEIVLTIAGDGPLLPQMKQFAKNLGVGSAAIFLGRIEPAEVPRYLNAIDVFLHCSQREGLPRACVQALLCGAPVVSYAVEGISDIVEDGHNGFIVSMNNVMDLEIRILQCLKELSKFREDVKRRRPALLHEFDSEKMISDLWRIYENYTK